MFNYKYQLEYIFSFGPPTPTREGLRRPGVVRGRAPNSLQHWLATRQSRSWQPGQLPWPFRWPR